MTREEESILRRAEAILAEGEAAFLPRMWDYEPRKTASGAACSMNNGPHVGNRVGHVQGGVLLGLAAATASAALPHNWALTGLTGWYVRPGQGPTIRARSSFVHHGQSTAVVRTQVSGREGKRVIEVMTTHAKGGGG